MFFDRPPDNSEKDIEMELDRLRATGLALFLVTLFVSVFILLWRAFLWLLRVL